MAMGTLTFSVHDRHNGDRLLMEARMRKVVKIVLLTCILTGATAGVAAAQWYPPGLDEYSTYRIPGTAEFFTGRGEKLINTYPDKQNTAQAAVAKPAAAKPVATKPVTTKDVQDKGSIQHSASPGR